MKLLEKASDMEKAIVSIKNRGARLDASIQQVALSTVVHAHKCGDTTLIDRLWGAMPRGSRRKSLTDYILAFAPHVVVNDDTKTKQERPFKYFKEGVPKFNLEAMQVQLWYEFNRPKNEDELAPFDLLAGLERLLARADAAQAKGAPVLDSSKLEALRLILGK